MPADLTLDIPVLREINGTDSRLKFFQREAHLIWERSQVFKARFDARRATFLRGAVGEDAATAFSRNFRGERDDLFVTSMSHCTSCVSDFLPRSAYKERCLENDTSILLTLTFTLCTPELSPARLSEMCPRRRRG